MSTAIAAAICFGSLLQGSPQVYVAQIEPVANPRTPKIIPVLANSEA